MYNNEAPPKRMLRCPHCHYDDLAFVTEYHKADVARAWLRTMNVLLVLFVLLFFARALGDFGKVLALTFNDIFKLFGLELINIDTGEFVLSHLTLLPTIIIILIVRLILNVYISRTERKTHVQAICRICGNLWRLN